MNNIGRNTGRFFEDFTLGEHIQHATPRTITVGDAAVYTGLFGGRHVPYCAMPQAQSMGYLHMPIDDMLVFHIVFGKTVPDISVNAVANLGYAQGQFLHPVYAGDTLAVHSKVIGLRATSNGNTGIVAVHTQGLNQQHTVVLEYIRQVMVQRRTTTPWQGAADMPMFATHVVAEQLKPASFLDGKAYAYDASGSNKAWNDYVVGDIIHHIDGMTIEEAEHQMATRLYQNTARIHFNQHAASNNRFGRRLIYGGHVLSLARALSFNGLENAFAMAAFNSGKHAAPVFAGDTVYASSSIIDAVPTGHQSIGALRIRTLACKNQSPSDSDFAAHTPLAPYVLLDWDYWVYMPKR